MATGLQLGVYDGPCRELRLSPFQNKLGGHPDFFPGVSLDVPPSCRVCGRPLLLLVQVYCPLDDSQYHRLLHVYCCIGEKCSDNHKSWLVLRSQLKDCDSAVNPSDQTLHLKTKKLNLSLEDWCDGAEDWESSDMTSELMQECSTLPVVVEEHDKEKEEDRISEQLTKINFHEFSGPFFPPSFIRVVDNNSEQHHDVRMPPPDELDLKPSKAEKESYEKATPKHGDIGFLKFHKKVTKCPYQVLRYWRSGNPLFRRSLDVHQTLCKYCGSPCVFEFQVMPTVVYFIQKLIAECVHVDGMAPKMIDFANVLVYTCSKSCWLDGVGGFREEIIHCEEICE